MKNKLRPLGQVQDDLEPLLEEMVDGHELQSIDVMALVYQWLETHRPGCFPVYTDDGSSPVFYYGPRKDSTSD